MGRGWFGWIVEGILKKQTDENADFENVVVQILKEEANVQEQARFREAVTGSKLAGPMSVNVLKLLGSCYESFPFLNVFEVCSLGDLKSYLKQRKDQSQQLAEEKLILKFCMQITNGVAALHEVGVIPSDLALRCCQITPEMNIKVGDYGLASTIFLEDYVPLNGDNQPIRWMPPEILAVMDRSHADQDSSDSENEESFVSAVEIPWTRKNGVWSLAITLWEVTSFGERPFDSISDNQFVVAALGEPVTLMAQLGEMLISGVDAEAIQSVIDLCFKIDPNARPDCERLQRYLTDFYEVKIGNESK